MPKMGGEFDSNGVAKLTFRNDMENCRRMGY